MNKERSESSFITIGSSSLLIVFLILALVVFSVLSLSTARRDALLSEKQARNNTAYYEACGVGEQYLAHLYLSFDETVEADGIRDILADSLDEIRAYSPELTSEDDIFVVSASIPAGETQSLSIKIQISSADPEPIVTQWKLIRTEDWNPDESYDLVSFP